MINISVTNNNDNGNQGLSLREAIRQANQDPFNEYIIELKSGETYILSEDGEVEDEGLTGDLDVKGNISIISVGDEVATIDGSGLVTGDRIFHVFPGANLNLTNISITQGKASTNLRDNNFAHGGGILVEEDANVNLINSIITGNFSNTDGGGIFNDGNLNILDSVVENNSSRFNAGGIFNNGMLTIQNGLINNNTTNQGGAIENNGILNITTSAISNNSASSFGGAIINGEQANLVLDNSIINNNSANFIGGINNNGIADISETIISENSAIDSFGGGIVNQNNGILQLTDSEIIENSAVTNSGGILNRGVATIETTLIRKNQAENGAGLKIDSGQITLEDIKIVKNIALFNGGGILTEGNTTLAANNIIINKNKARQGGGLWLDTINTGTIDIINTTIKQNKAEDEGAGIFVDSFAVVNIKKSTIDKNKAKGNGGAVTNDGQLTISQTNITNNNSKKQGGGIYNERELTIIESNIDENSAKEEGGGLYNNSSFQTNSINSSAGDVTVFNSTFSNNQTKKDGGGILNGGNLKLINSTLSGNIAYNHGGGLRNTGGLTVILRDLGTNEIIGFTSSGTGVANIKNSTIANNIADEDNDGEGNGGGISNEGLDSQPVNDDDTFYAGNLDVSNSIIAANFDTPQNNGNGDIFPDVTGPIVGNQHNLISNVNGGEKSIGKGSDIVNNNPGIADLADNGGFTLTHGLMAGSLAIDGGNNQLISLDILDLDNDADIAEKLPFDQRGSKFIRIINDIVDIGAFEGIGENQEDQGIKFKGDKQNNFLEGSKGQDTLIGGKGDDVLVGKANQDFLTGGKGKDTFRWAKPSHGQDIIEDFISGKDIIAISAQGFSEDLQPGKALKESQFVLGSKATENSHRFIYKLNNGKLWFDPDGIGDQDKILIATLTNESEFSFSDLVIY